MRKWHIPYIVGMVVVMAIVLAFIAVPIAQKTSETYQGKEVFRTGGEYTQFKEAIGKDGVFINNISVLSSEPPIVVQFNATVPPDMELGYGRVVWPTWASVVTAIIFSVVGIGRFGIWLHMGLTWED